MLPETRDKRKLAFKYMIEGDEVIQQGAEAVGF